MQTINIPAAWVSVATVLSGIAETAEASAPMLRQAAAIGDAVPVELPPELAVLVWGTVLILTAACSIALFWLLRGHAELRRPSQVRQAQSARRTRALPVATDKCEVRPAAVCRA